MSTTIARQIGGGIRALTPFFWCVVLIVLQLVPFGVPHLVAVMPNLLLCGAFYWTVNRPDLMPMVALFLLGIFFDLLHGGVIGLMPLTLLAVGRFAASQRRIFSGRLFILSWCGFIIVACGYAAANWAVNSVLLDRALDPTPVAMQTLMTIAVYPVIAYGLGRFQSWVLDR